MLDYSNEVLEQGLPLLVGDDRSCQVAENVRAASLNGIQVAGGRNQRVV